jgi:MoxR-like ATPase
VLLERDTFLDLLAGPPGRLILVGGEAGVGKTALVRAFAEGREVLGRVRPAAHAAAARPAARRCRRHGR